MATEPEPNFVRFKHAFYAKRFAEVPTTNAAQLKEYRADPNWQEVGKTKQLAEAEAKAEAKAAIPDPAPAQKAK